MADFKKIKKDQIENVDISQVNSLQTELDGKVSSDTTGITGASQVTNQVSLTQTAFDAITPDSATTYLITDA